jgi:hypothetical protein
LIKIIIIRGRRRKRRRIIIKNKRIKVRKERINWIKKKEVKRYKK